MKRQLGRPRAQAEAPRLGGACGPSKRGRTARATHHLQSCDGITVPQDLDIRDPNVRGGGSGGMRSEDKGVYFLRVACSPPPRSPFPVSSIHSWGHETIMGKYVNSSPDLGSRL